ncbi:hypothetical protein ACH5A2_40600 [Streptomyces collinus]|uniref:hypothetical protein n=1 Tax=Streptomyces collinus TaxID=42684 RepID=UPI0037934D98
MSRGASSIGSGGGGTIYEYRVAALDLVGLLCGVQVPGLDVVPDSVCLQKANDFPLDDVVVLNRQGSYELAVQRQVKRTLEIVSSSGPWRKTMGQCLASLKFFGDEIDADRHRLGLTASGPTTGLEALRDLAASAAAQKSMADFLQELPRLGQSYHRVWKHLTQTVSDLLAESDVNAPEQELVHRSAYRIARRLVVQIEPTEQISPRFPGLCAALQERVLHADTEVDAAGVFRMVEELAQEWGPRGGAINAAMLRNRLSARGVALRGNPPARSAVVVHRRVEQPGAEALTQAVQVQTLTSRTGRSARSDVIGELKPSDALRLEVHPAVDAEDVGSGALGALPPYIARPDGVDGQLRRMVAQSANGSQLVMVVGGSSTGKTRACWEAVRAELPSWRIVHPLAPDRPAALLRALQDDVLEPRTVLWLNEAQLYFLVKDYTAQVSSALQDLLTDSQRGPVLVLGTMWPTYWNHLADDPAEGDELHDGMGAVHQLANLALTITMPPAFNVRELVDAAALVASDPRLRLARSRATSGRITQFLAGAPHLVRRYEQSDGAARAILHAAMDARRCGHGPLLTEELLRTAAEGYIDEATWHTLDEGWFTSSLAELLKPRRKLPGPLTRYRPRPGEPSPDSPLYQLADILHEKGRTTRKGKPPASSLWEAAATHSRTDADMRELAEAARAHQADCEALYVRASGGDVSLLTWFIRRLIALGQFRRAEELIEERYLSGLLLGELSAAVGLSGQYGDSERLARRAFTISGNRQGHRRLAHHLLSLGMRRDATRVYSWAADHGDPSAARWLAGHYEAQGDRITADRLACAALTEHGSPAALLALAQFRVAAGEVTDAARLCKIIADHGHADALVARARERSDHRDHAAALCFYRAAAAVEHPKALEWMSWRCDGQATTSAPRTWHTPQRPAATATPCTAWPISDLPRATSRTPND